MKKTFTFFALFVCVFFSVSVFAAQLEEKIDLNQVTLMGNCNYSDLEHSALLGIPDGKSHTFAGVSLLNIDKLKGKGTCVLGVRVFIGDAVESGKVFLGSDYLSPEVEKSFEYKTPSREPYTPPSSQMISVNSPAFSKAFSEISLTVAGIYTEVTSEPEKRFSPKYSTL